MKPIPNVRARISFEIEVTVTATYQPGCPERGPTYSSGGEPAEPASVEDLTVIYVAGLDSSREIGPNGTIIGWKAVPLLDGCDLKSPDIQRFLANVAAFCRDSAEAAIFEEAGECA